MPTKEQVLRRLAEIEGIWCRWNQSGEGEYIHGWNPLDTPSDWAVLIEKYQVDISWSAWDEGLERYTESVVWMDAERTLHKSLPSAIPV